MKFQIHSSKTKLTPAIKDYIQNKIGKLDKYIENSSEVTAFVLTKVKGVEQTIEVTIPIKKYILRAEDTHHDLYAAVDLVIEKLERQIRKNKTRIKKKVKETVDFNLDFKVNKIEEEKGKIVKRKLIETKPMNEEEAILQMNLLGHDFFVYKTEDNIPMVVYRRNDCDYGVIEIA